MKHYLILAVLFLIFTSSFAEEKKVSQNIKEISIQINLNEKRIKGNSKKIESIYKDEVKLGENLQELGDTLKLNMKSTSRELENINSKIKSDKSFDTSYFEKIESEINLLKKKVKDQQVEISRLDTSNKTSSENSYVGALILLFGLLIEIIGAILLSTPTLNEKLKEVRKIDVKGAVFDIPLTPISNSSLIAMLTTIGAIFLIIGFTVQIAGTSIILPYSPAYKIATIIFVTLVAIFTLYFVLGLSGQKQSRLEKFKFIYIFIVYAIIKPLFRNTDKLCDYCRKSVDKPFISYYFDKNNFYNPTDFIFGHQSCLQLQHEQHCQEICHNQTQKMEQDRILNLVSTSDFIHSKAADIEDWHKVNNRIEAGSYKEFHKMISRVKKFLK